MLAGRDSVQVHRQCRHCLRPSDSLSHASAAATAATAWPTAGAGPAVPCGSRVIAIAERFAGSAKA